MEEGNLREREKGAISDVRERNEWLANRISVEY